jgi:L-lysine 6-transaminase
LQRLAGDFPDVVANPRGRGLMCAFDAPDSHARDQLVKAFFAEKLLLVGCGSRSIRFRPHLLVSGEEIGQGLDRIRKVLKMGDFRRMEVHQDPCLGSGT